MTFGNRKFVGFLGAATIVIVAEYVLVLSDSIISGQVLGEVALGAMSLLMPVFSTVSFFTWLLAVGTSIVYSDAMARMNRPLASRIAGQGLGAALLLGVFLVVVTNSLEQPYLQFMSPDEATTAFSGAYWQWYPLVVLLEAVDMLALYLVYTDGGNRVCLVSYVGQVVVNVVASYGLCAGVWGLPQLGMAGISLGTVLAYLTGLLCLLPRLLGWGGNLRFRLAFMPRMLFRSLRASFGDASTGLFQALLFFVITKYVIANWGSEMQPVTAVVLNVVRLTLFFNGVGIALQPLETVYHGEGNSTGVRRLTHFAASISCLEGLALTLLVFAFPDLVVRVVGITDGELIEASRRAVRLTVTGLSGYALAYMLNSHYQYVGRPYRSVMVTALAFFVMPVLLVLLLGCGIGFDGVWIAVAAGPTLALLAFWSLSRRARRSALEPLMWSVKVSKPAQVSRLLVRIESAVAVYCQSARQAKILAVVRQALASLVQQNPSRDVHAELTIKFEGEEVTVIVRDDGVHFAMEVAGVECVHLPVTGFNRNVFRWSEKEPMK